MWTSATLLSAGDLRRRSSWVAPLSACPALVTRTLQRRFLAPSPDGATLLVWRATPGCRDIARGSREDDRVATTSSHSETSTNGTGELPSVSGGVWSALRAQLTTTPG